MIVNPVKFQAIVVKKNAKIKDSYQLNNNDLTINSENSVKLLVPLSHTFLPPAIKQGTN